jgi:hypothetical protein
MHCSAPPIRRRAKSCRNCRRHARWRHRSRQEDCGRPKSSPSKGTRRILRGIDALAETEFSGERLLDGTSSYHTVVVDSSKILDVDILDKRASGNVTVSINVTQQATQAADTYSGGTLGAATTLLVTGEYGSATISLASGSTT